VPEATWRRFRFAVVAFGTLILVGCGGTPASSTESAGIPPASASTATVAPTLAPTVAVTETPTVTTASVASPTATTVPPTATPIVAPAAAPQTPTKAPAPTATQTPDPAVARGKAIFLSSVGCNLCHTIDGLSTGDVGPNLTHIASTPYDSLPNDPAFLQRWITNPQAIKPGTLMPDLGLSPGQVNDLVAFLETMK
jgi:cytochrome c2